jgi:excisionase family DNA binding protein
MKNKRKIMTVAELAESLASRPEYIYQMIRSGKLKAVRTGRRWAISLSAIERWLENAPVPF